MNIKEITTQIVNVLEEIQMISGLECPKLTNKTIPVEELPEFDSKIWPVATCIIANKLNISIPYDVNIFCDEKNQTICVQKIAEKILYLYEAEQITHLTDKQVVNKS